MNTSSPSFARFLFVFAIGFFVGKGSVSEPPFSEMPAPQAPEEQAPEPILEETCDQPPTQPAAPAPTKQAAARPQSAAKSVVKKRAVDTSTAAAFDGLGPPP